MEERKILLLKLFLLIGGLIGVSLFSFFYVDNLPSEGVSPSPICGTLMMAGCLYFLFMLLLSLVIAKIFMKHSYLGSFSLILAINVIIFVTIDIISIVIFQIGFLMMRSGGSRSSIQLP